MRDASPGAAERISVEGKVAEIAKGVGFEILRIDAEFGERGNADSGETTFERFDEE